MYKGQVDGSKISKELKKVMGPKKPGKTSKKKFKKEAFKGFKI